MPLRWRPARCAMIVTPAAVSSGCIARVFAGAVRMMRSASGNKIAAISDTALSAWPQRPARWVCPRRSAGGTRQEPALRRDCARRRAGRWGGSTPAVLASACGRCRPGLHPDASVRAPRCGHCRPDARPPDGRVIASPPTRNVLPNAVSRRSSTRCSSAHTKGPCAWARITAAASGRCVLITAGTPGLKCRPSPPRSSRSCRQERTDGPCRSA